MAAAASLTNHGGLHAVQSGRGRPDRPTHATIRISNDTDGTAHLFLTGVTDPTQLVAIDCSMAEWVRAHRDARPAPGRDAVVIDWL